MTTAVGQEDPTTRQAEPPAQRPHALRRVLWTVGLTVVVLALGGAALYIAAHLSRSARAADEVGRQFVEHVQAGRAADAYAMLAPPARGLASQQEFTTKVRQWRENVGEPAEVRTIHVSHHRWGGRPLVRLEYFVPGSQQHGRIVMTVGPADPSPNVESADIRWSAPRRPGAR